MDFSMELTDFPSTVHKNIYYIGRGIVPIKRSTEYIDMPDLYASCEEFHAFVIEMLSDMYDNPEEYHMPVMELENFCGNKKINGMKQKYPAKTKKILAITRNSVISYIKLLCLLGMHGSINGDELIVSISDMTQIEKNVSSSISPISLDDRFKALSRLGLLYNNESLVSKKYPNMFDAMHALATKVDKLSGFDFFSFSTLDFRNLKESHKPTHIDYYDTLISSQRDQAYHLHDYALQWKLIPSINTFNKVDYKYKGLQVMCISSQGDHERMLDVRITCAYRWDNQDLINKRLEKESQEFQKQALRHVWRCDACATTHLGMFVTVLGKRQRVCGAGLIGFRWQNPKTDELELLKRIIQLRCEVIDEIKA